MSFSWRRTTKKIAILGQLVRAYWWQTLIITTIIGLVLAAVLRLLTPPAVQVPEQSSLQDSPINHPVQWSGVRYGGRLPDFPDQLAPLRANDPLNTSQLILERIINLFQLKPDSELDNTWKSDRYRLTYAPRVQQYTLVTTQPPNTGQVDAGATEQFAREFVQSLPGGDALQLQNTSYFAGQYEVVPSSEEAATAVVFSFSPVLNGLPTAVANSTFSRLELTIRDDQQLAKMAWGPMLTSATPLPAQDVIESATAIEQINNQQATLLTAQTQGDGNLTLNQITSGTMNQVSLEYRYDPSTGLAYPFYQFSGTVESNFGNEFFVEVIVSALEE